MEKENEKGSQFSEVRFRQKIHPEEKCLMETPEEEMVPNLYLKVHLWFKKVIPEGKFGVEKKEKKGSAFEEVSLLHVRLGSRHHLQIFVAAPEISLCRPGSVATAAATKIEE